MRQRFLYSMAVLLAAACVPSHRVLIEGSGRAVGAYVGHWQGEYSSPETGRGGVIEFRLTPEGVGATGSVVMMPGGLDRTILPTYDPYTDDISDGVRAELLDIHFVRFTADTVSGEMLPYRDPHCGVMLLTQFEGTRSGDSVSGVFVSTPQGGGTATRGTWWAVRGDP